MIKNGHFLKGFFHPRTMGDRVSGGIIVEALLYVLGNDPPKFTVYDRFRLWCVSGIYIDVSFVRGCLGGDRIGRTKCGKASKLMTIVNEDSKPLLQLHLMN